MPKYIIVTGGVLSGLGKGIVTSSIGLLLKSRGYSITSIKIDPYLNCDAGTMSPFQHGEVFVLDDGGEVDLDLGNYERFLDINLNRDNNITTGKAYLNVIEKERRGDYLGKTVQIVPHVTDEIKNWIRKVAVARNVDICVVEVGGTVGDIESMPFLEAVRQLCIDEGEDNVSFVHTTLVPVLSVVGEQKTKPTQHSVKELRAIGILPDVIVARSPEPLSEDTKRKISLFCNVTTNAVFSSPDVSCIYEVPLILEKQGITQYILEQLHLPYTEAHLDQWEAFVKKATNGTKQITIAMVGKYTALGDSYMSILEAFRHAAAELDAKVCVTWIEAEDFKKKKNLSKINGILVPGGFGGRGAEGKIQAIQYARVHDVPFLGICFGFQLAVVEYGRHVLNLSCSSTEIDPGTEQPIVTILPEQKEIENLGGTMRLGAEQIIITKGTRAYDLYKSETIYERHRHRYEVNPEYIALLKEKGLVFSGIAKDKTRMEILELPNLSYFVASQFHPEFKSHPLKPAPLFCGFIRAALKHRYGVAK